MDDHPIALLDANVLITFDVRDTILIAAERDLCTIHWTDAILGETERNLPKVLRGTDVERAAKAARAVRAMRTAFPHALITGYERYIGEMLVDRSDRHVAAAAYRARAHLIVTFNLKHFPATALQPFNLHALHPDDFLPRCFRVSPGICADIVRQQARDRIHPARSAGEILTALAQLAPKSAAAIRAQMEM